MTDKVRRPLQRAIFGEGAERTSIKVDLVIRDNGDLVVDGYDIGAAPR